MAVSLLEGAEPILARQREARAGAARRVGARAARGAPGVALRRPRRAGCACGSSSTRPAPPPWPLWPTATACALGAGPRFGVDGAFERFVRIPYSLPADVLVDAVGRLARLAVAARSVSTASRAAASRRCRRRSSRRRAAYGPRVISERMFV